MMNSLRRVLAANEPRSAGAAERPAAGNPILSRASSIAKRSPLYAAEASGNGTTTSERSDPVRPISGRRDGGRGISHGPHRFLDDVISFRDFSLLPKSRELLRNEQPVDIGGRAFDLLTLLVLSQGKVVTKEQIFSYVWPSMTVDEVNLRCQMANIRKVLGHDRELIKTIPGSGYIFADEDSAGPSAIEAEQSDIQPPGLTKVGAPTRRRNAEATVLR